MTERIETSGPTMELRLTGAAHQAFEAASKRALDERWAERLAERDTTLWSKDPAVREAIAQRLGWLDAPAHFAALTPSLETFGEEARANGFTTAVVAGMGGSSLAPAVIRATFGRAADWLDIRVLDSTDPETVAATVDDLDPLTTLFIVASKSGTTTEPLAFQADAWHRITVALKERHSGAEPGGFMALISDPGRSVEALPHHDQVPAVFLNPPDIGGRYSALTYVGLLPASLMGIDLDELLGTAELMLSAATTREDPARNAALSLGLAIGTLARGGRDKLTFVIDPEIASLGTWLEQLIAESTGKHGVGIVPVADEPLGLPASYGPDRAFVRLTIAGSKGPDRAPDGRTADELLEALAEAGHPVIRIGISDPIDLGGEFVRWEVATAIAGAVLGIDPFDQPNVEEAKILTREILEAEVRGDRPAPALPHVTSDGLALFPDQMLEISAGTGTVVGEIARHLERRSPRSYVCLQAFIAETPGRTEAMNRIRALVRNRTGCATTAGYGPRFLHSTGQLHKGGAQNGLFIQLTADHPNDRPIPGWDFTFGTLIDAQAAGDFGALEARDRPVLRVHLGANPDGGLAALEKAIAAALG